MNCKFSIIPLPITEREYGESNRIPTGSVRCWVYKQCRNSQSTRYFALLIRGSKRSHIPRTWWVLRCHSPKYFAPYCGTQKRPFPRWGGQRHFPRRCCSSGGHTACPSSGIFHLATRSKKKPFRSGARRIRPILTTCYSRFVSSCWIVVDISAPVRTVPSSKRSVREVKIPFSLKFLLVFPKVDFYLSIK